MEAHALTVRETVDARKIKYGADDLDALFASAKEIVIAKGKRAVSLTPGEDHAQLVKLALGRSGNLRAPTVRQGKRFLVGYSEAVWDGFFGP